MCKRISQFTIHTFLSFAFVIGLLCVVARSAQADTPPVVWTWGANINGQLGDGSFVGSNLPVLTLNTSTSLSDVASVSAGQHCSFAVKTNGTVWGWGSNNYGNLGDGTTRSRLVAVPVKGPVGVGILTDVTSVSVSLYHALALKTDGTIWAWGLNGNGQLGDDTLIDRWTPVQVKGPGGVGVLTNVIAVSAGYFHSLALKADGTVWAWGYNAYGQLGSGVGNSTTAPVQVVGTGGAGFLVGVTSIHAGSHHSMAVRTDGTVRAWGYNGYGQLGDGTYSSTVVPVQVVGIGGAGFLTGVASISAAAYHSMAVMTNGTVRTWGYNGYGQLGDNTVTDSHTPVQVKGQGGAGFLTGVTSAHTSYYHALVRKADGTTWGWGWNAYGQLADGTANSVSTPVQLLGQDGVGFMTGISSVSAGTFHSTVLKSDGTLFSGGHNGVGQLGDGTLSSRNTFSKVIAPHSDIGLENSVAVASGLEHSLVARADGTVVAWGYNVNGELGDNTLFNRVLPVQVKGSAGVGVLTDVVLVSGGSSFSSALKINGSVWCWGYNGNGQLGISTYTNSSTPVQVKGPGGVGTLTGVVSLSSGHFHTLVLKADGMVWGWGIGGAGELGDHGLSSTTPLQVLGPGGVGRLSGIVAVSGGGNFSVALGSEGTVWTWGGNNAGQLGIGTTDNQQHPVRVKGPGGNGFLTDIVEVRAGASHCIALKADGTLWAWGSNANGQLGDNSLVNRTTPVQVHGLGNVGFLMGVVALSAGQYHSLVIKTDGSVWSWGNNGYGQLGNGSEDQSLTPVRVKDSTGVGYLNNIVALSAGNLHSVAIRAEGAIGGTFNLQNTSCVGAVIHFTFRDLNGGPDILRTITSGLRGVFSFTDIPPGRYDIAIKGHKWLQQIIRNVVTEGGDNILNLRVFLRGGDANDDNWVDVFDLDALIQAFNATSFDGHFNEGADFNCDESVDVFDLDILIQNFNLMGDE